MYDCWLSTIQSACNAGDTGDAGSLSGLGRSPREVATTQYSCLENSLDRGAWWATVPWSQRVGHDWMTKHAHIWHMYDCCENFTDTTSVILKTTWEVDTANISVFRMRNLSPERWNYLSVSWEMYLGSWSQELWGERRDERLSHVWKSTCTTHTGLSPHLGVKSPDLCCPKIWLSKWG